ncbi:hypothetical protein ACFQJC_00300 [Haloferax namakaokahaiae]|uniref:DUF7979 domain-containing protein n=1 Tax=Haloferax namakaokahaiae TaxID=1748331 RepID=A0ABD5Z9T0_9EURY
MGTRTALVSLLVTAMVLLSGCSGAPSEAPAMTSAQLTTTTATTASETTALATSPPTPTTTGEPQHGDNLLYTTEVNASSAMAADASKRADFTELTAAQQALFNQTYNCSCYVVQEEFRFNDDDRIEYVNYEGRWYFLRVAIV